jgi:hypothetical protein
MLKHLHSRRSSCFVVTRAALTGIVAASAFALLPAAEAQPAQSIQAQTATAAPYRIVDSLDALPQVTSDQLVGDRVRLPYLNPDDPATFAAKKVAAKEARFLMPNAQSTPAVPIGGPDTLNPAEAFFSGTSNVQCGAVSGFSVQPADQGLAVGSTSVGVLQGVNICLSVFDKTGVLQSGYPKATGTFFSLGALNNSDPRMIYDWVNHRYMFVVIAYPSSCSTFCLSAATYRLAISSGDNPAGGWCLYSLGVVSGPNPDGSGHYLLPDFPRLGQDREAIYLASNLYRGNAYQSEEVLALPKSSLYTCSGFSYHFWTGITSGFTIQPANVFLPSDQPKSMYFVSSYYGSDNRLVVWAVHTPFGASPFLNGIIINTTNAYSIPQNASQSGTAVLIDSGDTRISGSPYYAAGSIYAAITTAGGGGQPAIITYQIQPFVDTTGGASDGHITGARILNEHVQGGGAGAYFYPDQLPDGEGNVLTVFSYSASSIFPSLAWASRRAAQAVNTWPDGGVYSPGQGFYTGGRWGDYNATAPAGIVSGGGTGGAPKFWFAGMTSLSGNNWGTQIGRTGYTAATQN